MEHHPPKKLESILKLDIPEARGGKEGLVEMVQKLLQYSVNTWDQGFMDKLYASTNAVCYQTILPPDDTKLIRSLRLDLYPNSFSPP